MVLIGGISVIALNNWVKTTPPTIKPKKHSRRPTKTCYRWRPRHEILAAALAAYPCPNRPTATPSTPTWCRGPASAATLLSNHLRDRRFGEKARARSVRAAPPQYDPRLMTGSNRCGVSDPSDVDFGSHGLDKCMDLVERALRAGAARPSRKGTDSALVILECGLIDFMRRDQR